MLASATKTSPRRWPERSCSSERLDQIVLVHQASFYQQRAKPTPTQICRIHLINRPAGDNASFASLPQARCLPS